MGLSGLVAPDLLPQFVLLDQAVQVLLVGQGGREVLLDLLRRGHQVTPLVLRGL